MIAKYSEKLCYFLLVISLAFFYFNSIDFGCIFALFTYLTWPMDCSPETGLFPPKDKV